jgi:hypothetical protein
LLHELYDILEGHSFANEKDELTTLRAAMVEIEDQMSRLVDVIRFRGHDSTIGPALDSLESERKALTLQMIEAAQRTPQTALMAHIENLKSSLMGGGTISEINVLMRLVMKSIVIGLRTTLHGDYQMALTQDILKEHVEYDSDSGVL